LGEQVELVFQSQAGLWPVSADPGQVEQILMNLCVNARDAMPEGGQITIETANVSLDDAFIELHPWARPGDFVRFSVTDTGTGIPPEILDHIFEPFFTTKAPGRGTGLGQATVMASFRGMTGCSKRSTIASRRFVPHLFPPRGFRGNTGRKAGQEIPGGRRNETILLAEDDDLVRRMNVRVLESAGYRVLVAEDGVRAMDLFQEHRTVSIWFSWMWSCPARAAPWCAVKFRRFARSPHSVYYGLHFRP
jgi:CheY-like chemotaxis protein